MDYTRSWWDARPHPRLGTLEVRIPDQPTSVDRSAALAALVQAFCAAPPAAGEVPSDEYLTYRAAAARRPCADRRPAGARRAGSARARHLGSRRGAAQATGGTPPARDRSPRRARGRCGRARGEDRGMTLLHSVLYPLRLVRARLGTWSAPVVLVVLGIAAGAAVVVGGRAGASSPRIAPSRRRSSGFRTDRGRCGRSGSAFPPRAPSRSPSSTAGRAPR